MPNDELQSQLAAIVESSEDAIIGKTLEGIITSWNPAAERLYGYASHEVLGKSLALLFPPEKSSELEFILRQIGRGEAIRHYETERMHKSGTRIAVSISVSPIKDAGGRIVGAASIARDVSHHRQYRLLFQEMNEAFAVHEIILDREGRAQDYRFLDVNKAFEEMTGLMREDVVGKRVREVLPGIEEYWIDTYGTVALTGKTVRFENFSAPLGKHYEVTAFSPRRGHFATLFFDVTERKRFEAEREEVERATQRRAAELEAIFQATQAQLALLDSGMNFVMVNSAYATGSGHTKEQLIGRNHFELFPHAENQAIFERVRDTGVPYEATEKPFEFAGRPELGTTYWNWLLVPIRDQTGQVAELLLSLLDVTAQVRARQQMRQAKEEAECRAAELDAAVSSIPDAVFIYSPTGSIERMNQAAHALLGYSRVQMRLPHGERVQALRIERLDGRPLSVEESPVTRALRGETVDRLITLVHTPDGRATWIASSAAPIRASDDQMLGAVVVARDITAAREAQAERERLLGAEREARGQAEAAVKARDQFISIAAHELKTPVTSLRRYAELVARQYEKTGSVEPERLSKAMKQIRRQSTRLARLTEQLLSLTQMDEDRLALAQARTDLTDLVEKTVDSVRLAHPDRYLLLRGEPGLYAHVDGIRLEQAVRNLLDNALKYSPHDSPVEVGLGWDGPDTARIYVRDHGEGVPEGERERIFERLYQGHGERSIGGLGLGLFISRRIVEMHGGKISYEAAEGGGSRFVVRLPVERSKETLGDSAE